MTLIAAMTRPPWIVGVVLCLSWAATAQTVTEFVGRYNATSDVSSWANLARDAGAMRDTNDLTTKLQIYRNGQNAPLDDGTSTRSLASLSLDSFDIMKNDPMYSFFRHGFLDLGLQVEGESLGLFDDRPVAEYANTLVNDLFQLNVTNIETDAAVIMNVWMMTVHELYELQRSCKGDGTGMKDALDVAVALWVGADQERGSSESGNLLYNLAQIAGGRFDQGLASGEMQANERLMSMFILLEEQIILNNCNTVNGYAVVRQIVRRAIGYMTIPLVQMLIHYIAEPAVLAKSNYVELYALSLLPRVEACDPDAYEVMLQLFVKSGYNDANRDQAIALLQRAYSCLEVTCEQIGNYKSGLVEQCADSPPASTQLTSYLAGSDVQSYSRIDRDILQIGILMKAGAFDAADDYYRYGYNARITPDDVITLEELALDDKRNAALSEYNLFVAYYNNDINYGNTMMRAILERQVPFDGASTNQLAELAWGTLTYIVSYIIVLSRLYQAVETCSAGGDGSVATSGSLWDQGVAFFIGSMEGTEDAGAEYYGQMLFAAGKNTCPFFDNCDEQDNAVINTEIVSTMQSVALHLTQSECAQAEEKLETIVPAIQVPLFQGTLLFAAEDSFLEAGTTDRDLAVGHTFSRAILPIVNDVSQPSASIIDTNMRFQLDAQPVAGGAEQVFSAIASILPPLLVDCQKIGTFANERYVGGVCPDDTIEIKEPDTTTPPGTTQPGATIPPVAAPTDAPFLTSGPTAPSTATPSNLAFGRYQFETDVSKVAAIALDVRDMKNSPSVDAAQTIYQNGGNSVIARPDGKPTTVSMQELSTTAHKYMAEDPLYNIYRWALIEEVVFADPGQVGTGPLEGDSSYADRVTLAAFDVTNNIVLAAESTVILHVFMEIFHHLNDAVRFCEGGSTSATESVDRAVALWIGNEQTEGSFSTGHMMYSIAQQAAKNWGQEEGECDVNKGLMDFFNQAQAESKLCAQSSDKFLSLRRIVANITRLMVIPLLQNFLFFIDGLQENYIELYTVAIVPLSIACGESIYETLADHLESTVDFQQSDVDDSFTEAMVSFQQCYRISCDDLLTGMTPSVSLSNLIPTVCYNEQDLRRKTLAGFQPAFDVSQFARLDLDILQIGIFVESGAYTAALDYYENGYNSVDENGFRSLKSIATSPNRGIAGERYQAFVNYFDLGDYAHEIVRLILDKREHFEHASDDQRAEAIVRTLQCQVTYMAVLEALYTAVSQCNQSNGNNGVEDWEVGVALFVGSIEGPQRGGREAGDGIMLYGLAKELCAPFDTCENSDREDHAQINTDIMSAFSDGREMLIVKDCVGAQQIIEQQVVGELPVSIIQATLWYASNNPALSVNTTNSDLASGAAFADALLPLVKEVNATSEAIISRNMKFDLTTQPVPDGAAVVFEAFKYVLPGMDVNCRDIGEKDGLSLCDDDDETDDTPVVRPDPETPTVLGGDGSDDSAAALYTTTTYVQDRANIALDVVAIRNAIEDSTDDELAVLLYEKGANSDVYDDNGIKVGTRSFGGFSTKSTLEMGQDPVFQIFQYALSTSDDLFKAKPAREYANTIVMEYFSSTDASKRALATEAMIVLNLWMFLVHELFETLSNCRLNVITDADGIHSIDEAVAFWVGDGQITGSGDNGHLLYALAEKLGERFGLDDNGQTRTNTNILKLFNSAQRELSFQNACSVSSNTYSRLRTIVNKIVSQMTIPIVQGLIDGLRENSRDRVGIYANALVPLLSACDSNLFGYLEGKLLSLTYNAVEVEDIIMRIRGAYDCLGISCEDVGQHPKDGDLCVNTRNLNPLASYTPNNDVRSYAMLDLDILEASILMERGAYVAVDDLYTYGKHAVIDGLNGDETLSLSRLATTSERTIVPQYDAFSRYFEDGNYADDLVRSALNPADLNGSSPDQRGAIVVYTMSYMILFMGALQQMYEAVSLCESEDPRKGFDASTAWDRAAALLIGSIEGTEVGGNPGSGFSMYGLARDYCGEFGKCGPGGIAIIQDIMITLLYTGRGEVQGAACSALRTAVTELEGLILVPMIQAILSFALTNEQLSQGTQEESLAAGYIMSRSVLPLLQDVDREAATLIASNMDLQFTTKPVKDGAVAIFSAFSGTYNQLGVDCTLVGETEGINTCTGESPISNGGGLGAGAVAGIVIALIVVVGLIGNSIRRQRQKSSAEETENFVTNEHGEFNHGSSTDILGGKYNDADVVYHEEKLSNGGLAEQARPMFTIT